MRWLLMLIVLGFSGLALSQETMEIIPLRHRTAEQVLPSLRNLVEPGGALSGMSNQVIVRSSRKNIDQIKQALSVIDVPARRLLIHVSQNRDADVRQQVVELSGDVGRGSDVRMIQPSVGTRAGTRIELRRGDRGAGSRIDLRANDTRSSENLESTQAVQVVDGGKALIRAGQSLPLPLRQVVRGPNGVVITDSVVYRDLGQGFYLVPTLVGDRVTLEISAQVDTSINQGYGSVNSQSLSTTLRGRLGEWIELGGSNQQTAAHGQGGLGNMTRESSERRSLWLLVEELP